jgi:hypothetical protein
MAAKKAKGKGHGGKRPNPYLMTGQRRLRRRLQFSAEYTGTSLDEVLEDFEFNEMPGGSSEAQSSVPKGARR